MTTTWQGCCNASNRLADLICALYHPGDAQARAVAPVATWAEIIAAELGIDIPEDGDNFTATTPTTLTTPPLHIECRRWFQRTYGNTYHSVRIYYGGEIIAHLPFQYGYGEGCLQTAIDWLRKNRPDLLPDKGYDGCGREQYGTLYLREAVGATWTITDVGRKGDL